ncbi:PREDICTED: transcription factor ORG2-like isoform X2 [Lupinus angustifolius]|uniref:transcription factor ORG2-like isoform X2 n=1 Tax=Lupinus angustifolius TaxID=3871 RepID=UPI00092F72CB|nr:PREDICTED: transcription factor ORG2-like isoform X2 [Lupinus angustifolius]
MAIWPLEFEPISHNDNDNYFTSYYYSFPHQFSSLESQVEVQTSTPPSVPNMVKKLNHNASERDRRKRINILYSSLSSVLPLADQMKMSIPGTISQVLKYIPKLQKQVEGLTKKKEELLLRISQQVDALMNKESQRKIAPHSYAFVVSTSRFNDNEASIQISTCEEANKISFSEILLCLENIGLVLLNASSSGTFGERIFYNLHLQVEKTYRLESQILSEMLLSMLEKKI